ncbi:hypothetical protein A4J85_001211 [Salmonella enterica subsp. enterica]|nr:hypothetical protein [Salmonella enterica]EBS3976267.1 hypothetical protein [Salmonella enterica subsp. enterica serovar Woodinville]EBS4304005.1 hypothetical protein [Salmonella enterica subsp. enterica serovar Duesseldorf]EDT5422468.1 hypothetical protein [Salmonella enterica subsp. enterica]EDV2570672.1 hypothetical protein [Salmonella enterica subsp. enterica serovar Miami]
MTISDTKLRSLYGKPYSGPSEITDSDFSTVWNLGQGQSGRELKKCMELKRVYLQRDTTLCPLIPCGLRLDYAQASGRMDDRTLGKYFLA